MKQLFISIFINSISTAWRIEQLQKYEKIASPQMSRFSLLKLKNKTSYTATLYKYCEVFDGRTT